MSRLVALIPVILFATLAWVAAALPASAAEPGQANPRQAWQMLDYIAVDYAGAVQHGRIVAPGEYARLPT